MLTIQHPDEIAARFETKGRGPNPTLGIRLAYHVDRRPDELLNALISAGWEASMFVPPMPDGTKEVFLHKPGTGLFTGWTPEEARAFRTEARKILRRFGFRNVPVIRLRLEDLL